jgi:RimJ/RimL family protein N-acetyltransferase
MAGLMAEADLAIGAPGGTAWERCCLGLPSIVITLADNQRGIASALFAAGVAVDGGRIDDGLVVRLNGLVVDLLGDRERRMAIGETARKLVDGRGAQRILLELAAPVKDGLGGLVRLRLANDADETWLLALQAQPKSRQFARNKAVPTTSEHHEWFTQTLQNPKRRLYLVEVDARSAGMVRLDEIADIDDKKRFEISIVIDGCFQGRGVASAALGIVLGMAGGAVIDAFIFPENGASIAAFTNSGFTPAAECVYRFHPR